MATTIELVVPKLGESITQAVIAKWLKQVGEAVAVDDPVAELETDKVTVTLPSPSAGVLSEHRFPSGATVNVGEVIGLVAVGATAKAAAAPDSKETPNASDQQTAAVSPSGFGSPVAAAAPASASHAPSIPAPSHPSPTVRKALREGASHNGGAAATTPAAPATPAAARPAAARTDGAPAARADAGDDVVEVVAMTPLRKRIAERLVEAQHTAAILTTFNEVDMTNVMALRARFQEAFTARHGIKLGFMSFFARAVVESLRQFPGLNAELRGTDVLYKKNYHLGIAVGGGRGLVVPVLRHVERMGFAEIEHGIAKLAQRAKDNQLTLDELSGGTFSITNGGIYGSMMSTPLLNMPQTGILGMHNIIKRPIAVGDQIALRPMMYLALSYDHRVVDGREAVQFLIGVKERIESPERLMLEL